MSGEPWFAHSCRDGVRMWSDPDGEDPEWRMSFTLDGDCPARTRTGHAGSASTARAPARSAARTCRGGRPTGGDDPARYAGDGKVSCADALRSMTSGAGGLSPMALWWWGCALKYLWRWPHKGGDGDLGKAADCIARLREELGRAAGGEGEIKTEIDPGTLAEKLAEGFGGRAAVQNGV